jgi:hypothetical protein
LLLSRIYTVFPLLRPLYSADMRIIALITEPVRRSQPIPCNC